MEKKRQRPGLLPLLIVGGGLLLAVVIAARVVSLEAISDLEASNDSFAEASRSLDLASALELQVIELQTGVRGYLLTDEPRFLGPRRTALRKIPSLQRTLLVAEPPGHVIDRAQLQQLYARIDHFAYVYQPRLLALHRRDPAAAAALVASGAGKRQVDGIRQRFSAFIRKKELTQARLRSEASSSADSARTLLVTGFVVVPLLIALLLLGAARGVVAPVRRLAETARRLGEGDMRARAPESGAGELRGLASGFNSMAASIEMGREEVEQRNAELAEEKERIARYHRFVARIAVPGSLEDLATVLLEQFTDLAAAEAAALYVCRADGSTAELVEARGFSRERLPAHLTAGEGLAGRALLEGREILASPTGGGGARVQGFTGETALRHELHLPVGRHPVLGVVSLARVEEDPFGPEAVRDLLRMSDPAAVALANALARELSAEAARLNQAMLESANDAWIATDERGSVTDWSPNAEEMFGYSREEALGRPVEQLALPPELWPRFQPAVRELLARAPAAAPRRIETTVMRRDGRRFIAEISPSAVRSSRSGWVLSGFVRDIDARVQRSRERRATEAVSRVFAEYKGGEELLPRIADALGEAMGWPGRSLWEWDAKAGELRCTYAGGDPALEFAAESVKGMVQQLAQPPPETVGLQAIEARDITWAPLHPPTRADDDALRALREGGIRGMLAIPVTIADEPLVLLRYAIRSDQPPSEQTLEGLREIANLISQVVARRRAEQEAERLKDEFFALISHELRTPLTSIVGYLDAVREEETGELNEEQTRFLAVIDRNTRRLMRLVGDLLFVAQVEAGRLTLERGEVELDAVAREAVEAARPRAESEGVRLELDAEPVELHEADADRLGQMVDNLISNALKFTPRGGRVEVRLRRQGRAARLEVSDTGTGIPPEDLDRLFERFYRSPTAREAAVPGIGLGLSICQAIAEGHGGEISVESELGAGTTFTVALPIAHPAAKEMTPR